MAVRTYRVRVVRGEVQLEAEGDKKFVSDMLARFASALGPRAGESVKPPRAFEKMTASSAADTLPSAAAKAVSAGEFIRQFGFKRHTDIVLAFGYYLEQHTGLKEFSPADINNVYYEAKMESSNTSQAIIQNIRRGYMMPAKAPKGGKKRYTLTQSGDAYLRSRLQRATEKPSK